MAIQTALGTALYSKLTAAGGTALWSNRVYAQQAPQGAILPYVVFAFVSGGDLNISPSRLVDAVYQVECVAADQASAMQGADYIETALHDGTLTISGWNHVAATSVGLIALVDNVEGKQFYRRGHEIRIRVAN